MPKVAPLDNVIRQLARNRADKVRQAFADNPSNRYSVMKQMEDDLIGELTPILTKQWKPSMRRGGHGLRNIFSSGRFKNQLETIESAGLYDPEGRRVLSDEYFYGNRLVTDTDREKYGYLKRPKKLRADDDVDFYGEYDIRFVPGVRKRMTVTNGDSFDNWRSGHVFHSTPIVPDDPETYINWVAAPENFDVEFDGNPKWADEEMFGKVLDDLKTYKRPTHRFRNADYIEAQYHGPLTLDDIESITPAWTPGSGDDILTQADEYGFKVIDPATGKCIYNCR